MNTAAPAIVATACAHRCAGLSRSSWAQSGVLSSSSGFLSQEGKSLNLNLGNTNGTGNGNRISSKSMDRTQEDQGGLGS